MKPPCFSGRVRPKLRSVSPLRKFIKSREVTRGFSNEILTVGACDSNGVCSGDFLYARRHFQREAFDADVREHSKVGAAGHAVVIFEEDVDDERSLFEMFCSEDVHASLFTPSRALRHEAKFRSTTAVGGGRRTV